MSLDTRNGIIAIIAAGTMAALLILSLVGILVLAAVHDGELASHALDTFNQIIVVVVPAIAALAGVERVVTGITSSKAVTATAAVQVAQVNNGAAPTGNATPASDPSSEPTNDTAGAAAVVVPGENV